MLSFEKWSGIYWIQCSIPDVIKNRDSLGVKKKHITHLAGPVIVDTELVRSKE